MSHLMTKPTKWHVHIGSLATHWAHSKEWSDWADAQADLSLCRVHSHFVGFVMRWLKYAKSKTFLPRGERGGSVVECRTSEREVRGSKPTAAVLCPWARHFTPRKYWLITQEAMAPSRHDWKIVDWDVKPQHNQTFCQENTPISMIC